MGSIFEPNKAKMEKRKLVRFGKIPHRTALFVRLTRDQILLGDVSALLNRLRRLEIIDQNNIVLPPTPEPFSDPSECLAALRPVNFLVGTQVR